MTCDDGVLARFRDALAGQRMVELGLSKELA